MSKISRLSLATTTLVMVFLMLLIPSSSGAAALAPEVRSELMASTIVTPALIEALENRERVVARIYFLTPTPAEPLSFRQPREGAKVDPVVLELAQTMLPGKLGLLHYDFAEAVQGTVDARVVQGLLRNPRVVSIDLDETASPEPEEERIATKASCFPTSTRACVQGGRFSLEVLFSSSFTPAVVATTSSESAVFWFYSSTNWEVVAKVLNACAINNRFWIFGAGATGTNYQLNVFDYATGKSVGYNGAVLCPIADTGQAGFPGFPCS